MDRALSLPILSDLIPNGLSYGASYLVEFDPESLWYETSVTIAVGAIKLGIKTEYHTFSRPGDEVRGLFAQHGLSVGELEEKNVLRVLDTYSPVSSLETRARKGRSIDFASSTLPGTDDWITLARKQIKEGVPPAERRWLHIDDNTTLMLQYRDENAYFDRWRTGFLPWLRARELSAINAFVSGAASEAFYRKVEALYDGIIDIKSQKGGDSVEHYVRVRRMRGKAFDSQWHRLQLSPTGEVSVQARPVKTHELGIRRWIRGSKQ